MTRANRRRRYRARRARLRYWQRVTGPSAYVTAATATSISVRMRIRLPGVVDNVTIEGALSS